MLAAAVDDLTQQGRVVFGVEPTAKAAHVLESEIAMASDTVAKLLHEWRRTDRPPERPWRLPVGATVIVDEAGMINTGDLHQLTHLADAQRWRLVLVGDPRQLQVEPRRNCWTRPDAAEHERAGRWLFVDQPGSARTAPDETDSGRTADSDTLEESQPDASEAATKQRGVRFGYVVSGRRQAPGASSA